MTINNKYLVSSIIAVIMLSMFIFSASFSHAAASEELTGDAHDPLPSDNVITGIMDEYSKNMIIVNGTRYVFCTGVEFFSKNNVLITLNNIDAALEVKVFENGTCVRQVTVMSFSH